MSPAAEFGTLAYGSADRARVEANANAGRRCHDRFKAHLLADTQLTRWKVKTDPPADESN